MLVLLLVVDDDVHVVGRKGAGDALGRRHAVELADLRGALQHLHGVGVVVDFVRRAREHAEAAEGARLVARDALLEAGGAVGAGVGELDLLLRGDGHVEEDLGRHDAATRKGRE